MVVGRRSSPFLLGETVTFFRGKQLAVLPSLSDESWKTPRSVPGGGGPQKDWHPGDTWDHRPISFSQFQVNNYC